MNKTELVIQTKRAFDFIQKLYFEVSYLIKEMEGLLAEEDEKFIMGRPAGYMVSARSSNGLEPLLVNYWMFKKISTFFIPESSTKIVTGITNTHFEENPRVIYVRIVLNDKDIPEPTIYSGVLSDFLLKNNKALPKFEKLMAHMEYNETKVFSNGDVIDYEDTYIKFKGKLFHIDLYDIKTSKDIAEKIIAPTLKLYR